MAHRSGDDLTDLDSRQEPRLVKSLEMVAPGTALREGIDNVVHARTGSKAGVTVTGAVLVGRGRGNRRTPVRRAGHGIRSEEAGPDRSSRSEGGCQRGQHPATT